MNSLDTIVDAAQCFALVLICCYSISRKKYTNHSPKCCSPDKSFKILIILSLALGLDHLIGTFTFTIYDFFSSRLPLAERRSGRTQAPDFFLPKQTNKQINTSFEVLWYKLIIHHLKPQFLEYVRPGYVENHHDHTPTNTTQSTHCS